MYTLFAENKNKKKL